MEAYIRGIGIISPQKAFDRVRFLNEVVERNCNLLRCIEPSYYEFLEPTLARRMGRMIKMGVTAAKMCLKDAVVEMPDAIITGTSQGGIEASEKFLMSLIENDEQFLTPTQFMQSVHNGVSSQIALQLNCVNYNLTYVHRGVAFESAVLDGMMLIAEGSAINVLIGGLDEMTEKNFTIYNNTALWKKEEVATMELINSKTSGTIAGEGAAFFLLSNEESEINYAKIQGVKTIYKPINEKEIENNISALLHENGLTPDDIDVVIYGINGDVRLDKIYYHFQNNYFQKSISAYFKHLCGEYQTAGSFVLAMAAMMLKTQTIPSEVLIAKNNRKSFKYILIYNNFRNIHHTLFLLSKI